MPEDLEGQRRPTLLELLNQEPQDQREQTTEEAQEQAFLRRMQELARGLLDSEYWDLVSVSIAEELALARFALESPTIAEKDFRRLQGEVSAYRNIHDKLVKLAAVEKKEDDGKEPD